MGPPRERQMGHRDRPPEHLLQAHMCPQEGKTVSQERSKHTTHRPLDTPPSSAPMPPASLAAVLPAVPGAKVKSFPN
jgi:hypothetical protein